MKKRYVFMIIALGIIVIISNVAPVRYLASYILDETHYRYSNYSGTFTMIDRTDFRNGSPQSGLENCISTNFDQKQVLDPKDKILYRLFWRNPLCFWRWYDYFTNHAYDLPYLNWNDVQKRRGHDLKNGTSCQDF